MQDILQSISTVGFPIVMAILELYYIITRLDKMTDVIHNNTVALEKLTTLVTELEDNQDER